MLILGRDLQVPDRHEQMAGQISNWLFHLGWFNTDSAAIHILEPKATMRVLADVCRQWKVVDLFALCMI